MDHSRVPTASARSSLVHLLAAACLIACGGPPPVDPVADSDGDGILDVHEGLADPDGDGLPNAEDEDSDGDEIPDVLEAGDDDPLTLPFDSDRDGTPDFLDEDSDGNGIEDKREGRDVRDFLDHDGDGLLDAHDLDDDDDGIPDRIEVDEYGDFDTDRDGWVNRLYEDSDNDGLLDEAEYRLESAAWRDRDADDRWNWVDEDSDNDGMPDQDEGWADPDADGIPSFLDFDSDDDGLTDREEVGRTDPYDADSNGDGIRDGVEAQLASDGVDVESLSAGALVGIQPRDAGVRSVDIGLRGRSVDVVFLFGRSQRVFDRDALEAGMASVESELDVRTSWATAGSYPISPWANTTPDSFVGTVRVDVWPDEWLTEPDWTTIPGEGGGDIVMHAAAELLTGSGYDSRCDGVFDPTEDQPPWQANPEDVFGGSAPSVRDGVPVEQRSRGSYGLRRRAIPVFVISSYVAWVDPDMSVELWLNDGQEPSASARQYYESRPGGCPEEPGSVELRRLLRERGGYLFVGGTLEGNKQEPWLWLAEQQGVLIDVDGDGEADDLPYVNWYDNEAYRTGDYTRLREEFVRVLEQLVYHEEYDTAEITVDDGGAGLVVSHSPTSIPLTEGRTALESLEVDLDLFGAVPPAETDQVFPVTITVAAGGVTAIGEERLYIVVPGTGKNDPP